MGKGTRKKDTRKEENAAFNTDLIPLAINFC
jgi:hypothetical protein